MSSLPKPLRRRIDPKLKPRLSRLHRAAVALIYAESTHQVLLIRRPRRAADRWSGQLALPGGLRQLDESLWQTARREAEEEVGLRLALPVGRLPTVWAVRPRGAKLMGIAPYVFVVKQPEALRLDPREVDEALWVGFDEVARRPVTRIMAVGPLRLPQPVVPVRGEVLWGITLRVLTGGRRARWRAGY